jgi:hypothetical protein
MHTIHTNAHLSRTCDVVHKMSEISTHENQRSGVKCYTCILVLSVLDNITNLFVHFPVFTIKTYKFVYIILSYVFLHLHTILIYASEYIFFQVLFKVFFNYLAGVISLWLVAVLFILPTPLFIREFRRKLKIQVGPILE